MKAYQPFLVAVIIGVLLSGCYYLPSSQTGAFSFFIDTRAFTTPTYDAFQIQLYFEEDVAFLTPLPIGQDGALTLDVPVADPYQYFQGPVTIANILARRRYVLRVRTWNDDGGSGAFVAITQVDSNPFEVLPGQTTEVTIDFVP